MLITALMAPPVTALMAPPEIQKAYCSVAHNRFRHPCQNRIATLADGSASDVHLRTDLPKNKPTVSFLKATTAYLTLRAVEYLPASKGRSAPHNLPMEPEGSPSEDYSTSASPLHVSQRISMALGVLISLVITNISHD